MEKVAVVLFLILLAAYVTALEHADEVRKKPSLLGVSTMEIISADSRQGQPQG